MTSSSNVAHLLEQYDDKKDNVTIMTITYGDRKVVREIPLDPHKTHAHPAVEINTPSEDVYYTLVNQKISYIGFFKFYRFISNRNGPVLSIKSLHITV